MAIDRLLDSDSHICEPADLWEGAYMDPHYRGASPLRFVDGVDEHGRRCTRLFEGSRLLMRDAVLSGAAGLPIEALEKGLLYSEATPGAFDPAQRVRDLDREGITHQIVAPSVAGMRFGEVVDPGLAAAMCRAYNDWVADFCDATRGRVSAYMTLPWQDERLALEELERASRRECLRGVVMCPSPPYPNGWIGDSIFDPLYAGIEERGLVLILHSSDPFRSYLSPLVAHYEEVRSRKVKPAETTWDLHAQTYWLIFGFPIESWTAFAQFCFEGVLDRHPRLKIMFTESHGGWMVTALERMDEYARGGERLRAAYRMGQKLLPSEYFARQAWVVFEGDERTLRSSTEFLGGSMVWAADYPHADATFPGAAERLRRNLAPLPVAVQRQIAWDNGARAFGL